MSHTKGKLTMGLSHEGSEIWKDTPGHFKRIAVLEHGPISRADALRLVICWNVCESIPNKWLEGGAATIISHAVDLIKERDELVRQIREISEMKDISALKEYRTKKIIDVILSKYPVTES